MKILIIGLFAFFIWSALSTYLYVCKIKGLCFEQANMQIGVTVPKKVIESDSLGKPLIQKQLTVPDNLIIYFAFDKFDYIYNAQTDKYLNESNAYLGQNSKAMISITGHTDEIGTNEYNQALGLRRAQSMQHYFESKGMLVNKIIIESKGEKVPADVNNTSSGRANNRRTEITIKK